MAKSKAPATKRRPRLSWLGQFRPHLPKYFVDSFGEIRKVTWPSRREAWRLTLAVFLFSGIFMVMILLVDSIFKIIAEELFL